ncbi:MAG: hypothetical protein II341_02190 [Oscillospiraceae bacterium]|nr:hypothetical protein [Oscillospiraceae bacterium]
MMKKKVFAALTALICTMTALPVGTASALSWEEPTDDLITEVQTTGNDGLAVFSANENEVDDWKTPWTVTGIIIGPDLINVSGEGPCHFDGTMDSDGDRLYPGDVVELKLCGGIAEIYPALLPDIEHIERLGTAGEVYGYAYYTVTENTGTSLSLTTELGEEKIYSYHLQASNGFELYNSELVLDAQAGDTIAFMHNWNGNPIIPTDPMYLHSRAEFAVIGVDDPEAPQSYIIIRSDSPTAVYQLRADQLEPYLAYGGTPLSYGDIFTLAGDYAFTCIWGTNDILLSEPESIRIEGSVFDAEETAEFTLLTAPPEKDGAESFVQIRGAETLYEYPVDFVLGTCLMSHSLHIQPDGIDWTKPDAGDKVTMYTYKGVPMFPKSMQRIGDVSGDGTVNAADAAELLVNAAENGAGMARAVSFSADVNADSAVNALDAAAVLTYAAAKGSGSPLSWVQVLGTAEN